MLIMRIHGAKRKSKTKVKHSDALYYKKNKIVLQLNIGFMVLKCLSY